MSTSSHDLKDRQIQLLIDIDKARDTLDDSGNPMTMFQQITRQLKQHFKSDACAILLLNVQTNDTEAVTALGMPQDMALDLCHEATKFKKPQALSKSAWKYTLGLRIVIDREERVPGAIILARDLQPYTNEDLQLLELAESQIDSAIIQARTVWRLAERNRELEAIYQIDRLRDDSLDEDTLFANFTSLLAKHFKADLCQFNISEINKSHLRTGSIINKCGLSSKQLEAITETTRDLQTTTLVPVPEAVHDMQLLASPLIVSGERLGSIVIGRAKAFDIKDTRLMVALTSQIDTAISKSRTALQLAQRTRELEAIYRIDQIRDQDTDLEEMMKHVLKELCHAVSSETGYLMLYNADKEQALEIKASTNEDITHQTHYLNIIMNISREALDTEAVITNNNLDSPVHSIIAIPLILNEQVIGVFGAINSSNPRGFSRDDGRMLTAITSQVDTAVFERLERRRMRGVLSRSVDPKVLEALLKRADDSLLAGERVILSVLFADLRGSTEWAERTNPEELVTILNKFLGMMTDVIFKHNGTLDKFVGDEVIALFGSPVEMPDHALNAARAALEMQQVHRVMQKELAHQGRELPPMGIGISSGEVIAGEFGPPIRTDFTAMGRVMNLGSRLCSNAKANEIIISQNTYNDIKTIAMVNALEPITPKGIATPVQIYELLKINE